MGSREGRRCLGRTGQGQGSQVDDPRLEVRRRAGLVFGVHLHQRRVDVQHHRIGPRRVAAALPHSAARASHSLSEPLHHIRAQAPQQPIQSRIRRHIAEQHRLDPQMLDIVLCLSSPRRWIRAFEPTLAGSRASLRGVVSPLRDLGEVAGGEDQHDHGGEQQ